MNRILRHLVLPLLLLQVFTGLSHAVPNLINYQGFVSDSGTPIGSGTPETRDVIFRLYSVATGGTSLYSEQQTVTIADGDFSVLIGQGNPVAGEPPTPPDTLASIMTTATGDLFLGITVGDVSDTDLSDNTEISPRQRIVSTAFTFRAAVAESVDAGAITNAMLASGAVGNAQIANSAVDTAQIATVAVTTPKIAANAITTVKINDGAVTTEKLSDDAVTGAKIAAGTIEATDLGAGAVSGGAAGVIADGTITADDLAGDSVTTGKIKNGEVKTLDLENGAVTGLKISNGAVSKAKLSDDAVTSAKIEDGTIAAADLGAGTVTTGETLRIVRGVVANDGGIIAGTGFTVNKIANGEFKVTYSTAFSDIAAVTGNPLKQETGGGNDPKAFFQNTTNPLDAMSAQVFTIQIRDGGGNRRDYGFAFVAIGAR